MFFIHSIQLILLYLLVVCKATSNNNRIDLSVVANWKTVPFKLVVLESVSQFNQTLYEPLVEKLLGIQYEGTSDDDCDDDDELYDNEVSLIDSYSISDEEFYTYGLSLIDSDIFREIVNTTIATRYYSPSIEMHYQYFRDVIADKKYCATKDNTSYIVQGSDVYCEPTDVFALKTISCTNEQLNLDLLPVDHIMGDNGCPYFIYGDYRSNKFRETFLYLYQSKKAGKLSFVWRYIPDDTVTSSELLAGYGMDLTLKRTDYIVVDDRDFTDGPEQKLDFAQEPIESPATIPETEEFWKETPADIPKLRKEDIKQLGLKFTKFILDQKSTSDEEKLDLLTKLILDFPLYASKIAGLNYSDHKLRLLSRNLLRDEYNEIPNGFYINDEIVPSIKDDTYKLIAMLKNSISQLDRLQAIGIDSQTASDILSQFSSFEAALSKNPYLRYDYSKYEKSIIFFNDIAHDYQYAKMVSSRKAYSVEPKMGELPPARENIYETIFFLDLSDPVRLYYSLSVINNVLSKRVPERVGLVPLFTTKVGAILARKFLSIVQKSNSNDALRFLHRVNKYLADDKLTDDVITKLPGNDTYTSERIDDLQSFMRAFKIENAPQILVNGVFLPFNNNWQASVQQLTLDVYYLFTQYQNGKIPLNRNFRDYLYKDAYKIRIPSLVPDNIISAGFDVISAPNMNDFIKHHDRNDSNTLELKKHKCSAETCYNSQSLKTLTLIGDLANKNFRLQIIETLKYIQHTRHIKLILGDLGCHNYLKLLRNDAIGVIIDRLSKIEALESPSDLIKPSILQNYPELREAQMDSIHLIVDGRILQISHSLLSESVLNMIVHVDEQLRLKVINRIVRDKKEILNSARGKFNDKYDFLEYLIWTISDIYFKSEDEFVYDTLPRYDTSLLDDKLSLHIPAKKIPKIFVTVSIDPISEKAQKYLAMLDIFKAMPSADIVVHLHPKIEMETIGINRMYRSVFRPSVNFDDNGIFKSDSLRAVFDDIPAKPLFTLSVDEPQSWIVGIKEANTDLDNVKLDISGPVSGVYEVENIIIEGYSREAVSPSIKPVGLVLELFASSEDRREETSVMANFGYFQLKANPGEWNLKIKPGTKGADIYDFVDVSLNSTTLSKSDSKIDTFKFAVTNLGGLTLFPVFSKKPSKEDEFIISDGTSVEKKKENSGANYLSSFLSKLKDPMLSAKNRKVHQNSDINIFSIASGHLYERLLEIMAASVMKHTDHTVKFWFIENYMSPKLKSELPILSKNYGFQYQFITYKWPVWLRHQREKQRIIWAYKILFLDVLFPQDLKKVIFVDADQICRTDMKDLVDLDLEGAPYGFTPMCDSRKEMEGFRFWKKGYWKNVLGVKYKYHISALYVVDLIKFRSLAAGDILRQHYQELSKDPKSLSNLDQDLPNNLQDVLKIHSLPQNWLWCETWCSDESLKEARTIDLCNNPLTKESKLERAKRQIPEWNDYDQEIADITHSTGGSHNYGNVGNESIEISSINKHDEL